MQRRDFLKLISSGIIINSLPNLRVLAADIKSNTKFILVILRGGLDGLAMIPPYKDKNYERIRGELALPMPDEVGGVIDLDGFFGMHPVIDSLLPMYKKKDLMFIHAVSTPYRSRSHFDVQDVLENGTKSPMGAKDGWLNRLVQHSPGKNSYSGVALSKELPLILSGKNHNITTWYPEKSRKKRKNFAEEMMDLYNNDKLLGPLISEAIRFNRMVEESLSKEDRMSGRNANYSNETEKLLYSASNLLKAEKGPNIAVINVGGWDTHANQGVAGGVLANRMGQLATALSKIPDYMDNEWENTVFSVVTEFGRTVKPNGTRGTDHGTGSISLLGGGKVKGGSVYTKWPGLKENLLYEERDLRATIDMRSIFKSILHYPMGISKSIIEKNIFPDSYEAGFIRNFFRK